MESSTAQRLASFCLVGALVASGAFGAPAATVEADDPDLMALRAVADSFPPRVDGDAARARTVALFESLESRLLAAVAAAPTDYELRTRLGDLYRMGYNLDVDGADDKIEKQLREAIRLGPERPEAGAILGIHYAGSGRAAEGERELLAALPFATPELLPSFQISLAFACYQQGKFADSARYAGEFLKTHPDNAMAKGIYERSQATLAGGRPPKTVTLKGPPPVPPAPSPTPPPH
ncbi:MAG TPA: hypothetical protein VN811_11120 [Thermoanaerobaculia bacterium]|nr:hypothetical protein [Thermoanaerobaculia bacterium]